MKSRIQEQLDKLELKYTETDIENIIFGERLLKRHGLSGIFEGLLACTKATKYLEKLTEFNFTCQLINSHPISSEIKIEYEIPVKGRPVDLTISFNKINYFIQIKSLSPSIRDVKTTRILRAIKNEARKIKIKRAISLHISDDFSIDNVADVMKLISENLDRSSESVLPYSGGGNVRAEISFYDYASNTKDHLIVYSIGDIDAVNVTGMVKDQIKGALQNAIGAFEQDSLENNLNLIVSEISNDHIQAIDYAQAIYGTEYHVFEGGHLNAYRDNNGLFSDSEFSNKIAGIILLHRKVPLLTSTYEKVICKNPNKDYVTSILNLIHDRVIDQNTFIRSGLFS